MSPDMEQCPVCGEAGACGYDTSGRPLIHTDWAEVDNRMAGAA